MRYYPDITPVLQAKARRRAVVAKLSFGEKIEMMEALRERVAPLKRAREARESRRAKT